MCTVIVHVPSTPGAPVRLLAVRDEDPQRAWQPLGSWWEDTHPGVVGVRDVRAGGAWLAADRDAGRVAVILNRADLLESGEEPAASRGHVVLDAVAGRGVSEAPDTHGFNLVEATIRGVQVTMWDGAGLRAVTLPPGIHMIAHDDVDDPTSARIVAWRSAFAEPGDDAQWWTAWLDVLERTAALGPTDDRAIVRDNRPHGYPTLSLLVCAASISTDGVVLAYGEFDEPGQWNRPELH